MPPAVLDILTTMGLPGLVILGLCWWIERQDRRYISLQTRYDELQTKRTEDAQKMAGEALDLSDALKEQTKLLNDIKDRRRV